MDWGQKAYGKQKKYFISFPPLTLKILNKNNIVYEETEFHWGDDFDEIRQNILDISYFD